MKFLHEQVATWVPELSKMIQVNGNNLSIINSLLSECYKVTVKYGSRPYGWLLDPPTDEKTEQNNFPFFIFEKTSGASVETIGILNCDDYVSFSNNNEYISFLAECDVKKMLMLLAAVRY